MYIHPPGWWWHGRNSTSLQIPGILECETIHLSIFGGVVDVALNLGRFKKNWVLPKNGTEPSKHGICLVIWFCPKSPKATACSGHCRCWVWLVLHCADHATLLSGSHLTCPRANPHLLSTHDCWSEAGMKFATYMAHVVFSKISGSTRRTQKHVFLSIRSTLSDYPQRATVTLCCYEWFPPQSEHQS